MRQHGENQNLKYTWKAKLYDWVVFSIFGGFFLAAFLGIIATFSFAIYCVGVFILTLLD